MMLLLMNGYNYRTKNIYLFKKRIIFPIITKIKMRTNICLAVKNRLNFLMQGMKLATLDPDLFNSFTPPDVYAFAESAGGNGRTINCKKTRVGCSSVSVQLNFTLIIPYSFLFLSEWHFLFFISMNTQLRKKK